MSERVANIITTKENNKTLVVDNILLHSAYYPSKEAENFVNYRISLIEGKKNILVYGAGMGYHVSEILERISTDCVLHLFDFDKEVVEISLEEGILGELKDNKQLKLYTNYSKDTLKKFYELMGTVEDIIIFKPSLKMLPKEYDDFKEALKNFEISKSSIERFGSLLLNNAALNESLEYDSINNFFVKNNFNGETVIIISAGPSLDGAFEELSKLKGRCKLFAVGSALRPLMNKGIKPDMICLLDGQDIVYEQIKGYEDMDIPLCFLNTASNNAVSKYNGPRYIFYNEAHGKDTVIDTGKSVATAVLDIAIKGGGKRVVFIGQDLAYLNNKTHSEGYVYGTEMAQTDNYPKVIGVDGTLLKTTSGLLTFKRWIEKRISKSPEVEFINCSKGARIKGTKEMPLKDLI